MPNFDVPIIKQNYKRIAWKI